MNSRGWDCEGVLYLLLMLIISLPMFILSVCICKYSMRLHTYGTMKSSFVEAKKKKKVISQPQTRPITYRLPLQLQINLVQFYFVFSFCSWSPRQHCHKTVDPHDSWRVHWRTDGVTLEGPLTYTHTGNTDPWFSSLWSAY